MQTALKCLHCGSEHFDLAGRNVRFTADEVFRCLDCGGESRYGDLCRAAIEGTVEQYVRDNRAEILKKAEKVTDPAELERAEKLRRSAS
mgnify:CR=1 FL=1